MDTQSKNKFLYGAIILLLILNFGTLSFMWYGKLNQPKEPHFPLPPPRSGMEFLNEELKFTGEQNEKIEKLREAHFQAIEKIRSAGKGLRESFFSNLSNTNSDTNKINEIAAQIGMNQSLIELATYKHFAAIRNLCDDAQKSKFDSIIQDVLRMGPGGPPHGPSGMPPPRKDEYKQRGGNGRINPPGIPEGKEPPPKK